MAPPTKKAATSSTPSTAAKKITATGTSPAGKKSASTTAAASKNAAKKVAKAATPTPLGSPAPKPKAAGTDEPGFTPEQFAERERKRAAEMDELRQKAWLAEVEYERKQEAARRQKAEEDSRRRKETSRITQALLEAAFDGELQDVQRLIREGAPFMPQIVDTADSHSNTLLSEASAGGSEGVVRFLLAQGADPNVRGEFGRTALWRACFLGQAAVVPLLLEGGADPRLANEGGETPLHVASAPDIQATLTAWDTAETDRLVAAFEAVQVTRTAQARAEAQEKVTTAEAAAEGAQREADLSSKALRAAHGELEKRIHEYDTCVAEQKPEALTQAALAEVHAAEGAHAAAKALTAAALERLQTARLRLREETARQAAEGGEGVEGEAPRGEAVEVRDLEDVLLRDVGGRLAAAGTWPLVIDPSEQASVFLRYADTNYASALSAVAMAPDRLRKSLLGSLRYGKPFVLDFMGADLFQETVKMFDQVHPGLMEMILTNSLVRDEEYLELLKAEDGEEYLASNFQEERMKKFKVIFLTSCRFPNEALVERTYPLRVKVKGER